MVNNLPANEETWVKSLDQEDPLEKEMATHSNILAWKIPWRKHWWVTVVVFSCSVVSDSFCNPLDCSWEILKAGGERDDRG